VLVAQRAISEEPAWLFTNLGETPTRRSRVGSRPATCTPRVADAHEERKRLRRFVRRRLQRHYGRLSAAHRTGTIRSLSSAAPAQRFEEQAERRLPCQPCKERGAVAVSAGAPTTLIRAKRCR